MKNDKESYCSKIGVCKLFIIGILIKNKNSKRVYKNLYCKTKR